MDLLRQAPSRQAHYRPRQSRSQTSPAEHRSCAEGASYDTRKALDMAASDQRIDRLGPPMGPRPPCRIHYAHNCKRLCSVRQRFNPSPQQLGGFLAQRGLGHRCQRRQAGTSNGAATEHAASSQSIPNAVLPIQISASAIRRRPSGEKPLRQTYEQVRPRRQGPRAIDPPGTFRCETRPAEKPRPPQRLQRPASSQFCRSWPYHPISQNFFWKFCNEGSARCRSYLAALKEDN
jgi:hypothetical protein